jgi:hypothetical protein
MSTALEARAALSKLDGVVRVHAFGHNGKAVVMFADKKPLTKEMVDEVLKGSSKLKLRKLEKT